MAMIDREEAIRLVASYPGPVDKSVVRRILTQMPTVHTELDKTDMPEQGDPAKFGVKTDETCTDCISRQAAIKAIHEVMLGLFDFTDDNIEEPMTYTEVKFLHINKVIAEKIKALPHAQPEQKKGKWILCTEEIEETFHTGSRCSVCNYWKPMGTWNFCPNCGADMRGEQDG